MSKEECKGCSVSLTCAILRTKISTKYALVVWKELVNCPCNQCLVKAMCYDTQCDDFAKFSDKIQQILIHGEVK
jgi:hypothetical protein